MEKLESYLKTRLSGDLLTWEVQKQAAEELKLSLRQVEEAALGMGILPARYGRNRNTISVEKQLALFRSRVAVVGCGGLGGYIIEELARLGVGFLKLIDPDVFTESNLNRQILSTMKAMGEPKALAAETRVKEINPAVSCVSLKEAFTRENGTSLFTGMDLVLDALDSIPVRLALGEVCGECGIPLVHGAIGGWYGQVITQFPGDTTLKAIYGGVSESKGVETFLGNPSFTPAVIASIQVAEAVKILLAEGTTLKSRMLSINLLEMEFIDMKL